MIRKAQIATCKLDQLLQATSRTFGLAIPMLPQPTRDDVTVAYLLFRIADTLEDADCLPRPRRIDALRDFRHLLDAPSTAHAIAFADRWGAARLSDNIADLWLVRETPFVIRHLCARRASVQACIRSHAIRTSMGMEAFLHAGSTEISSIRELQQYCYYVAGIVGEMLTELFADAVPAFSMTRESRTCAHAFGEALQLVNILKDADEDARHGRQFLPQGACPDELLTLAREDLDLARRYIDLLRAAKADPGHIQFAKLPVALAEATLDCLLVDGPGTKVSREQVARIVGEITSVAHVETSQGLRSVQV